MRSLQIIIRPDDSVELVGVQSGKTTLCALNADAKLVALKVAGDTCWVSGFNPRQYVPAHYAVYPFTSIEEKEDGSIVIEVEELFGDLEWNCRRT